MSLGKLVVLEGIDGCGKDTQLALLEKWCKLNNILYLVTCEPTYGPVGNMIRDIFKGRINIAKPAVQFDHQMAYLFAADRHDHFYNPVDGIQPYLDQGYLVISMRYYFSSYAYHCTSSADFHLVERLNAAFPEPDLTIHLSITPEMAVERLKHRKVKDTYEHLDKLRVVERNYLSIFSTYPGRLLTIDGLFTPDHINEQIIRNLKEIL